ncbi:MAG: lipid A biosynthesis lauroyl acyltransferase [Pseudomonadales bacterium]
MPRKHGRRRRRTPAWHPRALLVWLLIACGWCIARLPLALLLRLGSRLGQVAWFFGGRRRAITETNLALCFPELSPEARATLGRAVFRHAGIGIAETLSVWLHPRRSLAPYVSLEGLDALRAAAQSGGVLVLGGHFSALECVGPALADALPVAVVYRRNRNAAWEWLQVRGRRRYFSHLIERDETRSLTRALRAGHIVWYAPDQDYGPRHSVFAPFFGVAAATLAATARIVRLTGATVFFASQHRDDRQGRWTVRISRVHDYPGTDPVADATRINMLLEQAIRLDPAQYLWLHRRFKTRPAGAPPVYPSGKTRG